MLRVKIPREIYQEARELAVKKNEARKANKDKFITGDEQANDIRGMVVEYLVCWCLGLPEPEVLTHVDECDFWWMNEGKMQKVDVKANRKLLVNYTQFLRKPQDLYFFADVENHSLEPWNCELELIGFISHKEVASKAELISFPNKSMAYRVRRSWLKELPVSTVQRGVVVCP